MKKTLFVMGLLSVSHITNAQLKVQGDGKVFATRTTAIQNADFSVGESTYNSYSNYRFGMMAQAQTTSYYCIGISGKASGTNSRHGSHIGVQGLAGYCANGKNFGILGGLNSTSYGGAGIFGTTTGNHLGFSITGVYAGYFDGDTYVDGTLTAEDIVTPSDIRLKENITSLSEEEGTGTLDNLMNLDVIHYNYVSRKNATAESDTVQTGAKVEEVGQPKSSSFRHYGVSAQQLQEIYPDIVRQGQDGYLGVNYVEMVPLLLRSIQELKQELDEVKGTGGTVSNARQRSGSFDDEQTSSINAQSATAGNVLYQNSPNPFTERTEIRFTLSDDARNAYIYIFDMTGKTLKQIPVDASMQSVTVGSNELSSGIYLYSLVVNGQEIDTKRMILSK